MGGFIVLFAIELQRDAAACCERQAVVHTPAVHPLLDEGRYVECDEVARAAHVC
jgi:hypothetical protein